MNNTHPARVRVCTRGTTFEVIRRGQAAIDAAFAQLMDDVL